MSRYQGRRVTDPKPVVRADIPDYPITGSGLEGAWETMTKAKSVLRRAEYRVLEADNPTPYDIGLGPVTETSVSVDRVPSYTISHTSHDTDKGMLLDDYGRTAYMKSKLAASRKISRLDNKYTEEPESDTRQVRPRSPLRESAQNHQQQQHKPSRSQGGRSRYSQHKDRKCSEVKYELDLKPVKYPDTASPGRVYWSDQLLNTGETSNTTDLSALRETDVRFLNDTHQTRPHRAASGGGFNKREQPKLTHVDINVDNQGSSTYPRNPKHKDGVNTTYTVSSKEAKKIRRLKMEEFKKKSDKEGIEKLKEKIMRQKLNMSSDTGSESSLIKDKQHHDNEAVVPKDYSLYDNPDKALVITRKVATGPAAPHYLGFNEAESRYTVAGDDSRPMKTSELQRFKKQLKKDQEMLEASNMQDLDMHPIRDTHHKPSSRQSRAEKKSQNKSSTTPKKMTRVVARKPAKQEHQSEVITTRSWRDGQKLIQKELGKMPKVREEGVGETNEHMNREGKSRKDRPTEKVTAENSAKILSANAKAVLEDLQSDKSDSEAEDEKANSDDKHRRRSSPPFKRKRPKSLEPVREEKKVKVPLYDRQEVQTYMKKKQNQAKQMEHQKKEEERIREEKRKENLKKLYDKQRESAKRSRSKGASAERIPLPANLDRSKAGSGSDKENMQVEDSDSATLTEESEPPAKISHSKQVSRHRSPVQATASKKDDPEIDDLIRQYLEKDKVSKEDERKLREQTTQELIQKYLKADAEAKKEQSKPELVAMVTNLTGFRPEEFVNRFAEKVKRAKVSGQKAPKDVIPHVDDPFASSQGSTKAERLRNLQFMSNSLSSKLRTTAANIESMPIDRWAQPVSEDSEQEETEFRTRYDRITGGNRRGRDVFTGDLPGVGSTYAVERSKNQNEAASRIQAAYRGHTVRQSLQSWQQEKPDTDNLSDSTQTGDSEAEYRPGTKGLGSRMSKPAYCATEASAKPSDDHLLDKYLKPSTKPKYAWDEQGRDPYTVFNAYARKQKHMEKIKTDPSYKAVALSSEESMELSDVSDEKSGKKSHRTRSPSHRTKSPTSHRAKSPVLQRSHSPTSIRTTSSYRDDFEPSSHVTKSHATTTHHKQDVTARSYTSVPPRREGEGQERSDDENDDTLEATTLSQSQSIDSPESERKPGDKSPSSRLVARSSKGSADVEDKASDMSESFTYSEDSESAPKDPLLQYSRESATTYPKFGKTGYDVPRMSPAALEHRMMVELGRLEGMEESVRQLTDVERTRGVSMAQQESVSLAQILKAKQGVHQQEMASLQQKTAQEKTDAAKQLDQAQKRASEAAHSAAQVIHQVRTDTGKSFEENTRKLIESQANAAKATFEAAKQLAENTAAMYKKAEPSNIVARRKPAPMYSTRQVHMGLPQGPREERATQFSQRSYTQPYTTDMSETFISDSFDSQSSYTRTRDKSPRTADDASVQKTESIKSESVVTADDMSKRSMESIQTESGASRGRSASQTESIPEDVTSEKAYSRMDSSMTEEEMDKISRDVMPSEGQRRKLKKNKGSSDIGSFSEDFPTVPSRRLSFEEDSFSKFAADFYEQYVHQEDMRQKHQDMLLTLREKAVNEKLSAEMAWYDQQKKSLRDKGADDKYPQLRKKQRGVIIRLKQEKAEIKKLQEVSRRQQEFLKLQMQDLNKMRHSSKQVREKLKKSSTARDLHTDDSLHGDETLTSPHKDYKSDSEVYSESNGRPPSPSDVKVMQKLKKLKQDEKYLTVREQRLLQRRKNAQDLLLWKQQLDEDEHEIEAMERKALAMWDQQKKQQRKRKDKREKSPDSKTDSKDTVIETGKYTPRTPRGDQTESIVSDIATESILNKTGRSITEDMNTTGKSFDKSRDYSQIESSIQEDENLNKKTHDSSDDTIQDSVEYTNDTFEDPTTQTSARKTTTSAATRQGQPGKKQPTVGGGKARDRKTTANGRGPYQRGSESESDDSLHLSETTSDQSDIEGRIRGLHEELKRRKLEVENLKAEHKRNKRDKLRQKEDQLKKKIEACDGYIKQVEEKIQHERELDPTTVKPQIKIPSPQTKKTPSHQQSNDAKSHSGGGSESESSKCSSGGEDSPVTPTHGSGSSTVAPVPLVVNGGLSLANNINNVSTSVITDTLTSPQGTQSPGIKAPIVTLPQDKKPAVTKTTPVTKETTSPKREKSELNDSFTEEIISEAITAKSETQDKSEVKLILDSQEKEDVSKKEEVEKQPDTARSITDIPEEHSYTAPISTTEKSIRDKGRKNKDISTKSDKSIYSEYSEDYDDSDVSQKSDRSYSYTTKSSKSSYTTETQSQSRTESKLNNKKQSVISEQGPVTDNKQATASKKEQKSTDKDDGGHTDEDISEAIESAIETESIVEEKDSDEGVNFDLKAPAPAEEINKSLEFSQELGEEPLKEVVLQEPLVATSQTSQETVENLDNISDDILVDDIKTPASPRKDDSALDRAIKEAENNLSDFVNDDELPNKEEKAELSPQATPTKDQKDSSFTFESEGDKPVGVDLTRTRAADSVAQNLMNEAIDQILDIRKNKVNKQMDSGKGSSEDEDEFADVDIPLPEVDGQVTVRPYVDEPPRPQSPDIPPTVAKDDIDQLYLEIGAVTGDHDEFWDDDFGSIGFDKLKPSSDEAPTTNAEIKLDLQKLTQEVFYAVPNKKEDIDELVDTTVDAYWEKRRYGENWDDLEAPSTLYKQEDKGSDLGSRSSKTYKHLVFDLTGEVLKDLYQGEEEEEVEIAPWEKPRAASKRKYYKGQKPPTTSDDLAPLMKEQVAKYLGIEKDNQSDPKLMKVAGRKKKDNVDQILIQELREEEPDWVNYDRDELSVKMQLSDAIFDSLLVETGRVISGLLMSRDDS